MSELAQLYDRALGAYLGLAIGDALGATVEFMRPREIQARYGVHRDIIGGGWLKLAAGEVTDDTGMCLALGDALLRSGPSALERLAGGDPELLHAVAQSYDQWLRSRPVDCGNTCRRGILRYRQDGSLSGPVNDGDAGNGALMRNLPAVLATLGNESLFEQLSLGQARLTHNHPLSDAAVLGFGQLTRLLLQGADEVTWLAWIADWTRKQPRFAYVPYRGQATAYVVDTVQTVFHGFCHHAQFEDALVATVNCGDDADTTGALVGMLAGARCGAAALPGRWLRRLKPSIVRAISSQAGTLTAIGLGLGRAAAVS